MADQGFKMAEGGAEPSRNPVSNAEYLKYVSVNEEIPKLMNRVHSCFQSRLVESWALAAVLPDERTKSYRQMPARCAVAGVLNV